MVLAEKVIAPEDYFIAFKYIYIYILKSCTNNYAGLSLVLFTLRGFTGRFLFLERENVRYILGATLSTIFLLLRNR